VRVKIIFAGTPQFAVKSLEAIDTEHTVLAVLTQPDRPAGRGLQMTASPVKQFALHRNIKILQPKSLKIKEVQDEIADLNPDVIVVAAYGVIVPKVILGTPHFGCVNIHASLLPRWRGAAPIQRAIQAGDETTGITIMQMDEGLDTGSMLLRKECAITSSDTAQTLYEKLAEMGAKSILKVLRQMPSGLVAVAQDNDAACYAAKLTKSEAQINWQLDAAVIERTVRALNPFPLCHFSFDEMKVKVWHVSLQDNQGKPGEVMSADKQGVTIACGKGALRLEMLQKPGGKVQSAAHFLQSTPINVGVVLAAN